MHNRIMYLPSVGAAIPWCQIRKENVERPDASRLCQQFLVSLKLRFLSRTLPCLADLFGFGLLALPCFSRPPDPEARSSRIASRSQRVGAGRFPKSFPAVPFRSAKLSSTSAASSGSSWQQAMRIRRERVTGGSEDPMITSGRELSALRFTRLALVGGKKRRLVVC